MCGKWWNERTSMEQCLLITIIITAVVVPSLIITLAVLLPEKTRTINNQTTKTGALDEDVFKKRNVCFTSACVNSAATLLKSMDLSVDPCEDFYQFTCGNFLKTTNIPADLPEVNSQSIIYDTLQEKLRTIIEQPLQSNAPKAFQLVKKLYKACINQTLIEKNSLKTIKSILKQLGGWPVLESNWNENDYDWKTTVYKFRRIGYKISPFIKFTITIDLRNSSKRLIELDQAITIFQSTFFAKRSIVSNIKAYYNYMVGVAVLLGGQEEKAQSELEKSVDFEIELSRIAAPKGRIGNVTTIFNVITIDELQRKVPSIPWLKYINTLLAPDNTINSDELVLVPYLKYFTDFEALISRTSKRTQANYAIWKAVQASIPFLNSALRRKGMKYETALKGMKQRKVKWKECIEACVQILPIATSAFYVRTYFKEEAKRGALEMVSAIRAEFENILNKVDWMDEKTRKNALDKAKSMFNFIGYPVELLEDKKLDELYYHLELDENNFLNSFLNITQVDMKMLFKRLREPVNKTEWIEHSNVAVINAFYAHPENSIQFPAGILQGIYFDVDRPRYMNYGTIGFVIGHEITHGFDNRGRKFDKNGNLVQWWGQATEQAFLKKVDCIINQYSNYTIPELNMKLNGRNTQGENIADNGGLKEAYLAYDKWVQKNDKEAPLPGLNYTGHQLFWISTGASSCSKTRKEYLKFQVLTGVHAPYRFRVIGTLSNLNYFANDFKCPKGSKMNPEHKCEIW